MPCTIIFRTRSKKLIHSIEGQRGEPTTKPPFPAESGLWDKPTCVNNVETLANVPAILLEGASWFNAIGSETSKGTKVDKKLVHIKIFSNHCFESFHMNS